MVPPSSHGIPRVPRYSGYCSPKSTFTYVTFTLSGVASQPLQLANFDTKCSPKPRLRFQNRFGLFRFRSPLLTKSRLISLPCPTWMFQFRQFPPRSYVFTTQCMEFPHADCSIRKSRGQSLLTTNPSLSQLTTSFIGSQCQGIHPALLKVSPFNQCPYMSSHCFENCSKNFTPDSFKTCR